MHLTLLWKTWTPFIFQGHMPTVQLLKKYDLMQFAEVTKSVRYDACFSALCSKSYIKSVYLGWLTKAGEAYSYQVIVSFLIGVRPSHFFISLSLQWRKSSPTEWCSDKAWDVLYSMWNLSYPWEAENHHIQESLQESVSLTKAMFLQKQI